MLTQERVEGDLVDSQGKYLGCCPNCGSGDMH